MCRGQYMKLTRQGTMCMIKYYVKKTCLQGTMIDIKYYYC